MADPTVDWQAHEVIDSFIDTQKKTIADLASEISVLKTKTTMLEKQLEKERKEREELPVPIYFIKQAQALKQENEKLKADLAYYKKHVPVQVIINKENKEKPTRRGGIPK